MGNQSKKKETNKGNQNREDGLAHYKMPNYIMA